MGKRVNDESFDFDSVDYMKAAGFTIDFIQGNVVTVVGIKESTPPVARSFGVDQTTEMATWVERHNRDGFNIYFHVNTIKDGIKNKKAKKADIVAIRAFHVDIDDPSKATLRKLRKFSPKPSIVLFSGGGFQAFWLLSEPFTDIDLAEAINAGLANLLGGDKCQNADRVMRVPETVNWPNAKKRKAGRVPTKAYLLEEDCDFGRTYLAEEFLEYAATPDTKKLPSQHAPAAYPDVSLVELGLDDDDGLTQLITAGDDLGRARGGPNARFQSRSEAYFSVACTLARRGHTAEVIAGVIANPEHRISEAILEKPKPREYAFRQAEKAIALVTDGWPDIWKNGKPRPTFHNALTGLYRLEVTFEHDAFKNRKRIGGHQLNAFQGDLSDDAAAMLRKLFLEVHGFDPGKNNLLDAIQVVCLENTYHPIRDYLDDLVWDDTERAEKWLIDYIGAEDTDLNRHVGKMILVAAVRRVRKPGCKFDFLLVIEGKQGTGKSTAVAILAGEGNFSDQNLITLDDKAQMEALEGVWLYEVAELDGMSRAEVSKIKAFISRTEDRGRPAYARFKESWPRQCVLIGTTNEDFYLKDQTGNRRFLPVKSHMIDLDALLRDRDQLWAEAAKLEADGFPISLPEKLWQVAADAQNERMQEDPWLDTLAHVDGINRNGVERVATETLFSDDILGISPAQRQSFHPKRIAAVMRELGWSGPKKVRVLPGTSPVRGYERPTDKPDTPDV